MLPTTNEGFPLSSQQRRIWSLQMERQKKYLAQAMIRITGAKHKEKLYTAFELIVQKHEIFRTIFASLPDMIFPLQVITQQLCDWAEDVDLSHLEIQEQEASLYHHLYLMSQMPFDLKQGSLCRASIVTLGVQSYVLLLIMPTLCSDSQSLNIITREFADAYHALIQGQDFSQETFQYADFATWQHELLAARESEDGLKYWRQQHLSHFFQTAFLSTNHPNTSEIATIQTFPFQIHPQTAIRINSFIQKHGFSLSTFLFACWYIVLWRYRDLQPSMVAILMGGRQYEELQQTVGLFDGYVPILSQLPSETSFIDFLQNAHEMLEEAAEWKEYFSWDSAFSSASVSNLSLPFGFSFFEQRPPIVIEEAAFWLYKLQVEVDSFELKLECMQENKNIQAQIYFESSLFQTEDIANLQESFCTFIVSALESPEQTIARLNMISQASRHKILKQFNDTHIEISSPQLLPHAFERQVERCPDAIAVIFGPHCLTYNELNIRSNQLAYYLQEHYVRLEMRIGICMNRSLELVIALLGILKSGCAYIPIDPSYPNDRIQFILDDAQPALIITQTSELDRLSRINVQKICLDNKWETISCYNHINPKKLLHPDNLAYIIYTSGSTGVPKGVMITHKALHNHMYWMLDTFGMQYTDRVLQKTPYSFDASIWEFYAPLLCGGALVIAHPNKHADVHYLIQTIIHYQVTVIQVVPSLLQMLLYTEQALGNCKTLRYVFCGGEELMLDLQERYLHQCRGDLYNLYGPSEACIDTTFWHCQTQSYQRIPIGNPITNAELYILDKYLQPVPIGCTGELYIAGPGIARGYNQRPDLTAERFIPHPFSEVEGARIYKTGDIAKFRKNGIIEFLGRNDRQIKIRGFRIELGEIESVLIQHTNITQCAVTLQEYQLGDQRLIGYIVSNIDKNYVLMSLHDFLAQKLPEYMIPHSFVFLNTMPLTPSGKVDRLALAHIKDFSSIPGLTYEPPRNAIEEVLLSIWKELLKVDQVGIHDNFFKLGGHSLLVTRLVSRIYQEIGLELSLRSIFDAPTIAELGEIVIQNLSALVDPEILHQLLSPKN